MRILLRLAGYGWRHPRHMLSAYFTMALATLSALIVPRLLGTAIDQALETGVRSELVVLALAIVGVSVVRGLLSYTQNYLSESLSQRAAFDLRNDFFRKLQSLSFGFHDSQQTGNLMSKATSDVDAVRWYISMGMIRGLTVFVMVVAVATLMLTTNWRLGLVSLAFVPLIMWRAVLMARKLASTWRMIQEETGNMTSVLQENLAGMRVVKSYGAREYEEARFNEKASSIAKHRYYATRLFASQGSLMTFILASATAGILWVGVSRDRRGKVDAR